MGERLRRMETFRSVDYNCTKTPLSFDWLFFTFLIFEVVFELLPTVPFLLLIEFLRLIWRQRHVGKWYTIVWPLLTFNLGLFLWFK